MGFTTFKTSENWIEYCFRSLVAVSRCCLYIPKMKWISLTSSTSDIFIGIFRIVTVLQLDTKNLTTSGVSTALWALAEPSVAILAACAPVYRPLLDKIFPGQLFTRLYNKISSIHSIQPKYQDPPLLDKKKVANNRHRAASPLEELELSRAPATSLSRGFQDQQHLHDYPPTSDRTWRKAHIPDRSWYHARSFLTTLDIGSIMTSLCMSINGVKQDFWNTAVQWQSAWWTSLGKWMASDSYHTNPRRAILAWSWNEGWDMSEKTRETRPIIRMQPIIVDIVTSEKPSLGEEECLYVRII